MICADSIFYLYKCVKIKHIVHITSLQVEDFYSRFFETDLSLQRRKPLPIGELLFLVALSPALTPALVLLAECLEVLDRSYRTYRTYR